MHNIRILLEKEWLEFRQQRGLLLSIIAMPLLLTLIPTVVLFAVRYGPPSSNNDELIRQMLERNPALQGMSQIDLTQVLLGQAFSSMFLLLPMMLPSIIAAYSIVGEKSNRTLEPLLATPISSSQLMAGKMLAALLPSLAITWACGALFILAARLATSSRVFGLIVSPGWLMVFVLCAPLLALIAVAAMVVISSRVNDPRTAQQYSAWLVVPFLAVFFGQLFGVVMLGPLVALLAALVLAAIAALAVWGATRLFQREVILTRWR